MALVEVKVPQLSESVAEATLLQWKKTTKDGSRSDLDFRPLAAVWELVESDSGNCLGKKCADFADCFYYNARRHIQNAKVLVVNHSLFFVDLALRALRRDGGILRTLQYLQNAPELLVRFGLEVQTELDGQDRSK
jgi:Rad3-related DNA helicase